MAACEMMRRVIGLAGVEDIRGIENTTIVLWWQAWR